MSNADIGTRAAEGNSMLASQLNGAPWANEVMSVDTLRRQIVSQVMHAEEDAFKARKEEEAALHRQQVAAAKAHTAITQNLMTTIGAAQTAVGANKFLGKMKAVLETTRSPGAPPRSPKPEGKVGLSDIAALRTESEEEEAEKTVAREKWQNTKKLKQVASLGQTNPMDDTQRMLDEKKRRSRRKPKMQRLFDRCDLDDSGQLERTEVGKLLALLGVQQGTEEYILSLQDLDPNNDGAVSYGEFKRYWDGDARKARLSQSAAETERLAAALRPIALELTVACTGLQPHKLPGVAAAMSGRKGNAQLFEAEDAHAVLSVLRDGEWCYYGKTERVQCGDSPEFTKVFEFPYYPQFAEQGSAASYDLAQAMRDDWVRQGQQCRLELFAKRFAKTRGGGREQIGTMDFTLHELVETPGRCKGQRLTSGKGVVAIRAIIPEETCEPPEPPLPSPSQFSPSSPSLSFADAEGPEADVAEAAPAPETADHAPSTLLILCAASKLSNVPEPKLNEDKQSGYFAHFRRRIGVGEGALFENELVACTEVSWQAVGKQNPRWMAFEISTSRLCYNNRDTKVRIDLYKVARDGFHLHLSSLDTTVAALCERAPEHLRSQEDGNMPPAPRESDFEEPWMQAQMLLSVDGADKPVGMFHVSVRDSKDGEFPKGETLTMHDRSDETFLNGMLREHDVQTSDLKDDVKNAQRLLNERKKFASEFSRRRVAHQQDLGRVVAEDHDHLLRRMLPHKAVEMVTTTQSMRDEQEFGHLQGGWTRSRRRNHHDLSWTRNYNVKPVKHQWNSRAVSTSLSMGDSYEQRQLLTLESIDKRAREMEMDALGITSRRWTRRSVSASRSQSRRRRRGKASQRPSTAPDRNKGDVRQSWQIPGSPRHGDDEENTNPQSDAHHRSTAQSHTQAVTVQLSKHEKVGRQANNVFRVIRQQMKSGNRKLYGKNLSNAKQIFKLMDKDKGGYLSEKEFGTALDRLGLGLSEQQKAEVLAVVDADGSGTVEYSEFIYILSGGEDGRATSPGGAGHHGHEPAVQTNRAAAWRSGTSHGRHGRVGEHVALPPEEQGPSLAADGFGADHLAEVEELEHDLMAGFRDDDDDEISPVVRDHDVVDDELAGRITAADLDVDSAGGDMYYTMHATQYNAAHGGIERKQAQQEGWFKGAMATVYGDARTENEGPQTSLHRKSG
jgi:Ca2+-binding EF-hand superfamily protein